MTQAEFLAWVAFYRQHPFDDFHRWHRPAALIARSIGGGDMKQLLDWLAPEPVPEGYSTADIKTMAAFGVKPKQKEA